MNFEIKLSTDEVEKLIEEWARAAFRQSSSLELEVVMSSYDGAKIYFRDAPLPKAEPPKEEQQLTDERGIAIVR